MSEKEDTAVEMFVGGLMLDPNTQAPVVVLKDESGDICLPIWIGVAEATSIASAIKQITMTRPLTHDLMYEAITELGAKVKSVLITDLKDSTYYAELLLSHGERALIIDSRPSDAIAIALRGSAPIYVSRKVLDQAKISFGTKTNPEDARQADSGQEVEGEGEADLEENSARSDFTTIDKDKWDEILRELDPEDFKYKM
jgi:uncharacterized protein